jgi:hypothetical protein
VSSYRDGLPEEQRPAYDQAADAFMTDYAEAWREVFEYAALNGTRAAAERAVFPGRSADEIEARLRQIQGKTHAPQDLPAAPDQITDRLDDQVRLVELQVVAASFRMDMHAVG